MYLKSEKSTVRNWKESDAEALAKYANNNKIEANLRDGFPFPYSLEEAHKFIASVQATDPVTIFAIEVGGEAIGSIGYFPKDNIYKYNAEIGYWIGEPFWGRGIIPEVLRVMTEYIFETTRLTRIYAEVFGRNTASARALEKAGFKKEATIRQNIIKNNKTDDTLIYSIHKTEFLNGI
ncbi:MAG: GNAT family N-acetyltransferase [Bacteroidetes bacterium]|nr:GNAT family N-acetyltransferase [Bacteroidota bacterium]MBL0064028.1 GNAT family N-acetyltransferase [Bacteroidota bacterium]MBL0139585.1 GNAT family N-acetyltransferase [Bacteroidota bacterium]